VEVVAGLRRVNHRDPGPCRDASLAPGTRHRLPVRCRPQRGHREHLRARLATHRPTFIRISTSVKNTRKNATPNTNVLV
jgi:hypothetical protein